MRPTFDELFTRHRHEIFAYLMRLLGNEADAQDAAQEVWLRAYRAYARLTPQSNVRAWLYAIATRQGWNAMRRRRRKSAALVYVDGLPAPAGAAWEQQRRWREVVAVVSRLPPKQHAALMQRQFHGLRYDEIATGLGCTPAAARANVYQAIKRLRAALEE